VVRHIGVNLRIHLLVGGLSKPDILSEHPDSIVGAGLCARPLFGYIRYGGAQRPALQVVEGFVS